MGLKETVPESVQEALPPACSILDVGRSPICGKNVSIALTFEDHGIYQGSLSEVMQ